MFLFTPLAIIVLTQMLKMVLPQIKGWLTILVALLMGVVVALLDGPAGAPDVDVNGGLLAAIVAIGLATLANKAGGGATGDIAPPRR